MKYLLFSMLLTISAAISWEPNFDTAKETAAKEHKLILLNFSGSDWCGPCIRMHQEIFADKTFLKMANDNLIMVNADFPRSKKKQPSATQKKQNEILADRYNPQGKFPFTLILDANGKVIKTYEGLPEQTVTAFTSEIKKTCDVNKN